MKDLERKYPELKKLLETYNYKFLALGMQQNIIPRAVIPLVLLDTERT